MANGCVNGSHFPICPQPAVIAVLSVVWCDSGLIKVFTAPRLQSCLGEGNHSQLEARGGTGGINCWMQEMPLRDVDAVRSETSLE